MLRRIVEPLAGWGPLPVRLVLGLVFLMHGGQKLFVFGLAGTAGFFSQIGIQPALLWATVVTLTELLGGLALLLGFLTRYAALLFAVEMVVAIVAFHLPKGFFLPQGYEFALTLLGGSLILLLSGPGPLSLDRGIGVEA